MKPLFQLFLIYKCLGLLLCQQKQPNIIYILADDLGWNDVSLHGSLEIPTPNIDALAMNGILLNNYYATWLCSPSRAALLSGIHPIRLGLQYWVIRPGERTSLPLNVTTLPQHLKRLGYTNHMLGKWHLGYESKLHTPTYRGFDSHLGYWNGYLDHFDHTYYDVTDIKEVPYFDGLDFHNGTETVSHFRGRYLADLFTEVAEDIIQEHDTSKPLFLYLAHAVPHIGNNYNSLQAPPEYVDRVKYIRDKRRRKYAAMMKALDDSVGKVYRALHNKGILDNTIIVFASDNGGETSKKWFGAGSNYPLRGSKGTLWEGGTRVPALIWSPLFNLQEPRVSNQLMQIIDWLPTLYEAAGGNPVDLGDIDGMSLWKALVNNQPSPRNELLYNIDPVDGSSAIKIGNMKLINGSAMSQSWDSPPTYDYLHANPYDEYNENDNIIQNLLFKTGRWIVKNPDEWRQKATISCTQPPPENSGNCFPEKKPCLFNIDVDPCEYHNLADDFPEVVNALFKVIEEYQKTAVATQSKPSDPSANPECHNFTYVTWLEPEYYTPCTEYL